MTKDEALKLALEALEGKYSIIASMLKQQLQAITAIKKALAQPAHEPLEYWNAVEGWVKIDEVREHFETVGCGTIYKTAGEGRVPVYAIPPAAQPAQEPVAWIEHHKAGDNLVWEKPNKGTPLYTTPPQRPWVGLTDEEIEKGREQAFRWAENALKEKNN